MKENELLAYGSIVALKGIANPILIIGINQTAEEKNYDYCGCIHPYGYINGESLILFNNADIEKVIFNGYVDDLLKDYYDDVIWLRDKQKKEDK